MSDISGIDPALEAFLALGNFLLASVVRYALIRHDQRMLHLNTPLDGRQRPDEVRACDALYSVVRLLPVTRFRVRESFLTVFSRFINSHLHLGSANLSACLIGNQEVGWINRRALVKRLAEPGLDTRIGERWVDAGWAIQPTCERA